MAEAAYEVRPDNVRQVTSNVTDLVSQTQGVVGELASTVLDGTKFATIGTPVASANNAMQGKQVDLLQQLTSLLSEVNQLVTQSADQYQGADQAVAQGFGSDAQVQLAQATDQQAQPAQQQDLAQDQEFRDRLAVHEDRRAQVYTDTEGHPTVGVGFNLDRADAREALTAVGANYDDVRAGRATLTDAQINGLLDRTAGEAVTTARNYFNGFDQLDVTRQRVIADMAFNLGPDRLGNFQNLHEALTNGDYNAAANEMADSRWADQVGRRADRLVEEMRTGQPQPID